MTTFAVCPSCGPELFPLGPDGNSGPSRDVTNYKSTLYEKFLGIAAPIALKLFFGKDLRVLSALENAFSDAIEMYADGDIPLKRDAFKDAMRFLLSLPNDLQLPELEIEENGNITMEWYSDKWNIFSVTLDGTGVYYYAGLFGDINNRDKGRKPLSEGIDDVIPRYAKKVLN